VIVISINSCSEKQAPEPETVKQKNVSLQKTASSDQTNFVVKDSLKGSKKDSSKFGGGIIVEPDAQSYCYKTEEYWVFEKYVPVAGKSIGISPHDFSPYWMNKYHNYYGFSKMKIKLYRNNSRQQTLTDLQTAYDAGYTDTDIMGDIGDYPVVAESEFDNFGYYYSDEPLETAGRPSQWPYDAANFIHAVNPQARFKVGTSHGKYAVTSNDDKYKSFVWSNNFSDMTFTAYFGGILSNVCDQSEHWTYFKNFYGTSKALSQWIHLDWDYDGGPFLSCGVEYPTLLSSATAEGINELWLYADDSGNFNYLDIFCLYANIQGWLNRFQRRWVYHYRCINQNPCNCDPNSTDYWILENSYPTNATRIIN